MKKLSLLVVVLLASFIFLIFSCTELLSLKEPSILVNLPGGRFVVDTENVTIEYYKVGIYNNKGYSDSKKGKPGETVAFYDLPIGNYFVYSEAYDDSGECVAYANQTAEVKPVVPADVSLVLTWNKLTKEAIKEGTVKFEVTPPTKTSYAIGDIFDSTGLKVEAVFDNDYRQNIPAKIQNDGDTTSQSICYEISSDAIIPDEEGNSIISVSKTNDVTINDDVTIRINWEYIDSDGEPFSSEIEIDNAFTLTINVPTPKVINVTKDQPKDSSATITIETEYTDDLDLQSSYVQTYQWYRVGEDEPLQEGTALSIGSPCYTGVTSRTLEISFANEDKNSYQYYCKVTNTNDRINGKKTASAKSETVTIKVDVPAFEYEFREYAILLPEGTEGTAATDGIYVEFGDWPQTIKADSVVVDETVTMVRGAHTYYKGSDGYWYAKVLENARSSSNTYSDGTTTKTASAKSYRYFKVEPIKWRVLNSNYASTGEAFLAAENILTAGINFYDAVSDRNLGDITIKANNYKYSNIRAWLNGINNQFVTDSGTSNDYTIDHTGKGFLQTAFSEGSQEIILDTVVDNSAESTNPATKSTAFNDGANDYACENTTDKIFLLSLKEVTTTDYGFTEYDNLDDGSSRDRSPVDFAWANYFHIDSSDENIEKWLLRSPYYSSYVAPLCVANNGSVCYTEYTDGVETLSPHSEEWVNLCNDRGIVPALKISSTDIEPKGQE